MNRALRAAFLPFAAFVACAALPARAAVPVAAPAECRVVDLGALDDAAFARLVRLRFDVERNGRREAIAYVTPAQEDKLEALGFAWTETGLCAGAAPAATTDAAAATYHTYDTLTSDLQALAAAHPDIVRLSSAGATTQGRRMWWVRIGLPADSRGDRPVVRYLSSIHGDELVGMEMLIRLAHWLAEGYAGDARARNIVENVETWIMPLVNPDGAALGQRWNAAGVDLNRTFPDQYDDPRDVATDRPAETANLMNWQAGRAGTLSANLHGGSLVYNYPYDNNAAGASVYSAAPDDDTFITLAYDYAVHNGPMFSSPEFHQGMTNGAAWYAVSGGMQDWLYHYRGEMAATIELSNTKMPAASTLDQYWSDNRESLLAHLERALTGVRGLATDAVTGAPVAATIRVRGRAEPFRSDAAVGDFHRPLVAGAAFTLDLSAPGYAAASAPFSVADARGPATRVNVALTPLPPNVAAVGARAADDDGVLAAGETTTLAVTVREDGGPLAGLSGTLESLDPWLAAESADGTWPALRPGAATESNAPHFAVSVPAGAPSGHKVAARVAWTAPDGTRGATAPFFVPLGAAGSLTAAASGLPAAIPDVGSVQRSVVVADDDDAEIASIAVAVTITHPYPSDLRLTLVAPSGQSYVLAERPWWGSGVDAVFGVDRAPLDSLAPLVGTSCEGTWTLRVEDLEYGNTGSLTKFELRLTTRPFEDPIAAVPRLDVAKNGAGAAALSWWPVGGAARYVVRRAASPASAADFADITASDADPTDTSFVDAASPAAGSAFFYVVKAVGHLGEGA